MPLAPMPAATEVMSSMDSALTLMSPSAWAVTPESMKALVVLVMSPTSAPKPTATVPEADRDPATETMEVSSFALTEIPGLLTVSSAVTLALRPTKARVVSYAPSAGRARGVPAVLSPKGELMSWALGYKAHKKGAYMRLVGAGLLRRAAALHCSDALECQATAALGLPTPTFLVPNALDTGRFQHLPPRGGLRRRLGIHVDDAVVLCLGRLHPVKRPDLALSAFARIAGRYDLLNRLMTFGRDRAWRKEAIGKLLVKPAQRILDAGSGTGDIALEIKHLEPTVRIVAADLTIEMIKVGKARPGGQNVGWVVADAQNLPFPSSTFKKHL